MYSFAHFICPRAPKNLLLVAMKREGGSEIVAVGQLPSCIQAGLPAGGYR